MSFPKILAPLLPRKRSKGLQQENKESNDAGKEFILSPAALLLSPPSQQDTTVPTNENGDSIIELSTTYEEASNSSQETLTESSVPQEVTENALVLHEKPTAFELCDNDLIIESVKDVENEQEKMDTCNDELESADKEMMRDNAGFPETTSTTADTDIYATNAISTFDTMVNSNVPEIDFAPPAEFMNKDDDINPFDAPSMDEVTTEPAMVALPPSPPVDTTDEQVDETQAEFTTPVQADLSIVQADFIQPQTEFIEPIQTEQEPNIFTNVSNEPEANFAMETTFHKTDTVKSKWLKILSSAKTLVCKPDRTEDESNNRIKSLFDSKFESNSSAAGQENSTNNKETEEQFVSAYDKQMEEDAKTPIYRRRNTSHASLFQMEGDQPILPYKSPVIGSEAYNIKLLCDQSFFGRW